LLNRYFQKYPSKDSPLEGKVLGGVPESYRPFVISEIWKLYKKKANTDLNKGQRSNTSPNRPLIFIVKEDSDVDLLCRQLSVVAPGLKCLEFPGWDCLPYDRVSPSLDVITKRLNTLMELLHAPEESFSDYCVITSVAAVAQRVMPRMSLLGESLQLKVNDEIARADLLNKLTDKGFRRCENVYEPGDFAVRGGIIDIFPSASDFPFRLDFFGDTLESIKMFDPATQRSIAPDSSHPEISIDIRPVNEVILCGKSIDLFKNNYRVLPFVGNANKFSEDPLLEAISNDRPYPGMEHWLPLFYENLESILDYLPNPIIITESGNGAQFIARHRTIEEYYQARLERLKIGDSSYRPMAPDRLYWSLPEWEHFCQNPNIITIDSFVRESFSDTSFIDAGANEPKTIDLGGRLASNFAAVRQSPQLYPMLIQEILANQQEGRLVAIISHSEGSRQRLESLLADHSAYLSADLDGGRGPGNGIDNIKTVDVFPQENDDRSCLYSLVAPFDQGFKTDDLLIITEQDILGERMIRKSRAVSKGKEAFQYSSQLTVGDLVVHSSHGIGRYIGLETHNAGGKPHDFLALEYKGGDKLYVPVESIEQISRYGQSNSDESGYTSHMELDKLGSVAWQNRKARTKKRIREIADHLLKIAAERELLQAPVLSDHNTEYEQFCAGFPYVETEDQQRAIEDVLEDLGKGKPMDRLVCGDVGFGKTEIALRAAFVAAANGKQVILVAPTTILCYQHFRNFTERFKGTNYKVGHLSRLVKTKQLNETKKEIQEGKINIVVATHAAFASSLKFNDLGLVIIDEEQRFGVKQKEKLKDGKSDVHVLTLTATPIPRTLQMALAGVRGLSVLATAPISRLAVRTFVMPYDSVVIKEAIMREYNRGGQIFYVVPHVNDLEKAERHLKSLVPDIKIMMAHGRMRPNEIEDVITSFCDHKFDLLLCTPIVESGIDIPNANTIIIHRANMFGLAQMYQLRGRVGRTKVQGYAYMTIHEEGLLTGVAKRRLDALQSLDTLGAGFRLASHDMDIRGAGNLVGEEQSGHIKEVGVELYQQLLQEAILMAKAMKDMQAASGEGYDDAALRAEMLNAELEQWSPKINIGIAILIPEYYVEDLGVRMELYRKIALLKTNEEIDGFAAEMVDRFGKLPLEVENLLSVIEMRRLCRQAHIEKLDVNYKGLVIRFKDNVFPNQLALLRYIQNPAVYKLGAVRIHPDNSLSFARNWPDEDTRIKGTKKILLDIKSLAA